jgi:quinoprotein glucose dehydrogenase
MVAFTRCEENSMSRATVIALAILIASTLAATAEEPGWAYYGGDAGGQRYSAAVQITPANVASLKIAWTFSTHDMATKGEAMRFAGFEDTPILAEGKLFVCSPFNEVSALDPGTGKALWHFDPRVDRQLGEGTGFVCRSVAFWRYRPAGVCAARIFMATTDRRLFALDAETGRPCDDFGDHGVVSFIPYPKMLPHVSEVLNSSGPVVARGVVIVGSSITDNLRVNAPRGTVHAYDAITGAPRWTFDPIPRSTNEPNASGWTAEGMKVTGAANVWAPMSVDEARGLVFLPTTSPSPDFWGGMRAGDDRYADSVVAVHAATGEVAWSFQITHHNLWDYDLPAEPTLGMVTYRGKTVPAVLQATKQGMLFTLERDTGEPVIPVQERRVPQGGAPGEHLSPTEPFPIAPAPLTPNRITPDGAFGLTFWDRGVCRKKIAAARNEGIYTPPSLTGSIEYPFGAGGTNWGGLAFDEKHDIVYVNTSNAMQLVTLIPRDRIATAKAANPDLKIEPQAGAPFAVTRRVVGSPLHMPCNPPPWGQLHAVDMHDGRILWNVPLGTTEDMVPFSEYVLGKTGTPNLGGPIVTASGLVFIGAAMDNYLRAFDAKTGAELWRGRLPAGGQATPMTYMWRGRQYVVIAAGGHAILNTKRGDDLVAFALPR